MRDYFPNRSHILPSFSSPSLAISLTFLYNRTMAIASDQLKLSVVGGYTLVNMHMSIYDKIAGKTAVRPRRPASADQTLDHLSLEGQGYNSKRWLNGQNPKDPNNWYHSTYVPMKSYRDWDPGPRHYKPASAPPCPVCGSECTNWNTRTTGLWWCHFCAAKVQGAYSPLAMLPEDLGDYLLPSLSDRQGLLHCHRCSTSMLPRSDNSGYACPKCQADYKNPAPTRPGPII